MESTYLIENYVHTAAGEAFRLFPFGKLYKSGKLREITAESAKNFNLPHFKPPIKLGSHIDSTPAGGHIKSLEVRSDGIYGVPEYTEKGSKAIEEGDYKYNSPEILWEDQGLEDPMSGEMIPGPLIVGVALLHTPHLGEAAALYHIEPVDENHKELEMTEEMVSVPFLERVAAILRPDKVGELEISAVEVEPVLPENYEAEQEELTKLRAEVVERQEADVKAESLSAVKKEFDTEEFGVAFIELSNAEESAEVLASMNDEQRTWVLTNFKAMSKQIEASGDVTKELGNSGDAKAGSDAANVAVEAHMAEHKVDYLTAFNAVRDAQPEIFEAGKE